MQLAHVRSRTERLPSRVASAGFTLTELIVVVAIIAILATFVSAALNEGRGKAYQIGCLNNLRQLQIAWSLYIEDNSDELPLNKSTPGMNERIFGRRNTPESWVAGNPKEDVTTENIRKGSLFAYVPSAGVYRCPADQSRVVSRKQVRRTRSYSMSAYLRGDGEGFDPRVKVRHSELINPSPDRVFVFIEESPESPWIGSFTVDPRDRIALASKGSGVLSLPAHRHKQGGNLSFADGHVEYWQWHGLARPTAAPMQVTDRNVMRDIRRLQESIPKP
jgi:prepilin-type N-terminal cleavage/methylation domain-containing protein/prepilin-type processing-associated H-X9-DG protein